MLTPSGVFLPAKALTKQMDRMTCLMDMSQPFSLGHHCACAVKVKLLSHVRLFATPWIVDPCYTHQLPYMLSAMDGLNSMNYC